MAENSTTMNYYQLLDVPEYASPARIKEAYAVSLKRLNKEDFGKTPVPVYEEKRQSLEIAYQTLTDDKKRKGYDRELREQRRNAAAEDDTPESRLLSKGNFLEEAYHQGLAFLEEKEHLQAIAQFRKVMKYEKNNSHLLKLLAKAYNAAGEFGFALHSIEKAIELKADDWESYLLLGKLLERKECLADAREAYCRAYQLNPQHPAVAAEYSRGSLIKEKTLRSMKTLANNALLPDREARTFRLSDGLITKEMALRLISKFRPVPSQFTFRYTGLW